MQFDAYADAVERYGLEGRPGIGDGATVGETIAQARARYQQMIDAMSAYTLKGGRGHRGGLTAKPSPVTGPARTWP